MILVLSSIHILFIRETFSEQILVLWPLLSVKTVVASSTCALSVVAARVHVHFRWWQREYMCTYGGGSDEHVPGHERADTADYHADVDKVVAAHNKYHAQ